MLLASPAAFLCVLASVRPMPGPQAGVDEHEFDQGSFVELESVTPVQGENLVTLAKVWGFLKYHHPLVTSGQREWDAELFRVLPAVLDASDRAECAAALLAWIQGLGEPAPCTSCAQPVTDAHLQPELAWLADEARLGPALAATLARVHANRSAAAEQHHVAFVPGVGNPIFAHERAYEHLPSPDTGYRLLALFRFWNAIAYWFPYRDVIGADWDGVLAEFVPRFVAAGERDAYRLELVALIARANDSHANLWGSLDVRPPRGTALLPVIVRFVEGRALVCGTTDPARPPAELRVGDVLLALDGRTVADCLAEWSPYYAASNEAARQRDLARELTRGAPGAVRVRVEREGRELELAETRIPEERLGPERGNTHDLPGPTFRLLSPEVAYLKLSSVKTDEVAGHVRAAAGTRGLVVDIRNYPSEFVVFALGQLLVREPTPFACFTAGSAANPGAFQFGPALTMTPSEPHYAGRVVILVDEVSQSQAEYTAMALRVAPDALVVGSTTAGADGNVSPLALPGGLHTMISGIGVFTPDRTPTQRVGIRPDLEVRPTIAGLRAGRDEVLEAGLRAILGEDAASEVERIAREARAPR